MVGNVGTITNVKTIMMILVVFYHSCLFFSGDWFTAITPVYEAPYIVCLAKWLNTFHVPAFVAASGYLFYYLRYDCNRYRNFQTDVIKRSKKLLLPTICCIVFWVYPVHVFFYGFDIKIFVEKFLFMIAPNQLWFMPMLFCIFVIFHKTSDFIKPSIRNLIVITLFSVIMWRFLGRIPYSNIFQIRTSLLYIPFFFLGSVLKERKDIVRTSSIFSLFFVCIGIYFMSQFMHQGNFLSRIVCHFMYVSISLIEVSIVYIIIAIVGNNFAIANIMGLKNFVCRQLARNSFGIYLFHQQVIYFIDYYINGSIKPMWHVIITFVLAIIISNLIVEILRCNRNISETISL